MGDEDTPAEDSGPPDGSHGEAGRADGSERRNRSGDQPDGDVATLRADVEALADTLERIEGELTPGRGRGVGAPRLRDFRRFTADVTIPLVILVLETNVRALRIFQRALRPADAEGSVVERTAGRRAADMTRGSLDRLDGILTDLQNSVTATDANDSLSGLLEEATTLQRRVADEIDRREGEGTRSGTAWDERADADTVSIDVEAELASLKDQLDEDDGDEPT